MEAQFLALALGLACFGQPAAREPAPAAGVFMAFGDSITDGVGSSDEEGFRRPLQEALSRRFDGVRVVNEGMPAADSRRGQHAIAKALARQRPFATLILLGSNDWADEPREPRSTVNSLRRIVRAVTAAESVPFLATIPPVNQGFDANMSAARNAWVARANALIREMAPEEGAVLVDVHAAFVAHEPLRALFSDGVHPNDAGYALIADAFVQAITRRLASTSPR